MMIEWVASLGPWAWIIAGLVLLGLELLAPGTFFMWLGIAAVAVGLVSFFNDVGWQIELVLFVVFAIASVIVGRRYFARNADESTDTPGLNERGQSYVGREVTLAEPLVDGRGRVKLGDTMWRVEGPSLPAGTQVRVTGVRSGTLLIEPV